MTDDLKNVPTGNVSEHITLPDGDFADAQFDVSQQTKPDQLLIILSTPRSGSTLLCDLIFQNGLCLPHEYLQPHQYLPLLARRWGIIDEKNNIDFAKYVKVLEHHRTFANGCLGLNLHGSHLSLFTAVEHFFSAKQVNYIRLTRRDLVKQAVSYARASITGEWSSTFEHKAPAPEFNFDRIDSFRKRIQEQNLLIDAFLSDRGIRATEINYEDIIENPEKQLRRIPGLQHAKHMTTASVLKCQRDGLNEQHAGRYRADLLLKEHIQSKSTQHEVERKQKYYFFPDYSHANPYQTLLYQHFPKFLDVKPGTIEAAQMDLETGSKVFFHLHWTNSILYPCESGELLRAKSEDFLKKLKRFVSAGGEFFWTVHNSVSHEALENPVFKVIEQEFYCKLVDLAHAVHVHSRSAFDELKPGIDLKPENTVVIPHGNYVGWYTDEIDRNRARQRLDVPPSAFVVLFLGLLRPYKGINDLVAAFRKFHSQQTNSFLLIAGRPLPPMTETDALAWSTEVPNTKVFPRYIDDDDLQLFFNAADVCVLPYTHILTSGSVLGALSFGCPVVAPRFPMIEEVVHEGVNGFLFTSGDQQDLLRAIKEAHTCKLAEKLPSKGQCLESIASLDWKNVWPILSQNLTPEKPEDCESSGNLITAAVSITEERMPEHSQPSDFPDGRKTPIEKTPQSPLISIIIPTFEHVQYIGEALESALQQNGNFEVLVVIDESTDRAADIVRNVRDRRVRFIREEYSGVATTRNRGIRESHAEYILWAGSDDRLAPETVADYEVAIRRHPEVDVFYGNVIAFDDEGTKQDIKYPDYYNEGNLVSKLLDPNLLPDQGYLIKKTLYLKVGYFNEIFPHALAYEFWSRAAPVARFKHVARSVYEWRQHNAIISVTTLNQEHTYEAKVVKSLLEKYAWQKLFPDLDWEASSSHARATSCERIVQLLLQLNDIEGASQYLEIISENNKHSASIDTLKRQLKAVCANRDGERLFAEGHSHEAIRQFDLALGWSPTFPDALNNMGVIAWEQGDLKTALTKFTTVLQIDPLHVETTHNAASILAALGKQNDAIKLCRVFLSKKPFQWSIRHLMHSLDSATHGVTDVVAPPNVVNNLVPPQQHDNGSGDSICNTTASSTQMKPSMVTRTTPPWHEITTQGQQIYNSGHRFYLYRLGTRILALDQLHPEGAMTIELEDTDALDTHTLLTLFIPPILNIAPITINERPKNRDDLQFWQYPAATERQASNNHLDLEWGTNVDSATRTVHTYLGLPWATYIDKQFIPHEVAKQLQPHLSALRQLAAENGYSLAVHTVCQHIAWERLIEAFKNLGITDLHLSHALVGLDTHTANEPLRIQSWPLFAPNVEDPTRRTGLIVGKPPGQRRYLASFIGAHMPHYRSDVRIRLSEAASMFARTDVLVEVGDVWHFEKIVYQEQVSNRALTGIEHQAQVSATHRYNEVLCDSLFSLCPEGAGPNTLRLWESLAVGSIPVVISDDWQPPQPRTASDPDLRKLALFVPACEIPDLFDKLAKIPLHEIERLQRAGIDAYPAIHRRRTFVSAGQPLRNVSAIGLTTAAEPR